MLYPLFRNALFRLDAERTHDLVLPMLDSLPGRAVSRWRYSKQPASPLTCCGISFKNPIGLAAGLDKNGDFLHGLSCLGFGFLEIGTVTPRPQSGNDKPRLFRLPEDQALINRMGFNNKGVDHLLSNLVAFRQRPVGNANNGQAKDSAENAIRIGVNIGKNKDTDNARAIDDYVYCLRKVYDAADYITVNISSPNTPGLRDLQLGDARRKLLQDLRNEQISLQSKTGKYVPLLVKIAPDMPDEEITAFANDFGTSALDGLIATNTTNSDDVSKRLKHPSRSETGGISGHPVAALSRQTLKRLRACLPAEVPIIAAGGILSAEDATERLNQGASLLQVYTGLIYHGPRLISDINRAVVAKT